MKSPYGTESGLDFCDRGGIPMLMTEAGNWFYRCTDCSHDGPDAKDEFNAGLKWNLEQRNRIEAEQEAKGN